jgi:hypothetical protein
MRRKPRFDSVDNAGRHGPSPIAGVATEHRECKHFAPLDSILSEACGTAFARINFFTDSFSGLRTAPVQLFRRVAACEQYNTPPADSRKSSLTPLHPLACESGLIHHLVVGQWG